MMLNTGTPSGCRSAKWENVTNNDKLKVTSSPQVIRIGSGPEYNRVHSSDERFSGTLAETKCRSATVQTAIFGSV